MTGARCGALSAEYDTDGTESIYECLLPAGHEGQEPEPGEPRSPASLTS